MVAAPTLVVSGRGFQSIGEGHHDRAEALYYEPLRPGIWTVISLRVSLESRRSHRREEVAGTERPPVSHLLTSVATKQQAIGLSKHSLRHHDRAEALYYEPISASQKRGYTIKVQSIGEGRIRRMVAAPTFSHSFRVRQFVVSGKPRSEGKDEERSSRFRVRGSG
jgi:hypothetical protein